jgi:hypothetical protein
MRKKLYIKSIAHKLKMKPEDLLFHLAEHNIILATVINGTLESDAGEYLQSSVFRHRNVPISEEIVLCIATDGIWQGKMIIILHGRTQIKEWKDYQIDINDFDVDDPDGYEPDRYEPYFYEPRFTHVTFKEEISLTSTQLFVYEDDFSRIEPTITGQPPTGAEATTATTKVKRKYKPRCAISAATAATFLGISPRQVQNWDRGINTPSDYPGRENETLFLMFVNRWNQKKQLTAQAKAMNKAVSDSEAVARATKSAFDD